MPSAEKRISRSSTTQLSGLAAAAAVAALVRRRPTLVEPPTRIPCGPVTPSVRPAGANLSTPPSGTAGIGFNFSSGAR